MDANYFCIILNGPLKLIRDPFEIISKMGTLGPVPLCALYNLSLLVIYCI